MNENGVRKYPNGAEGKREKKKLGTTRYNASESDFVGPEWKFRPRTAGENFQLTASLIFSVFFLFLLSFPPTELPFGPRSFT